MRFRRRRRFQAAELRYSDTFVEAAAAIGKRPVRTLLTALGTILGVGAFVATTGLADTARAQVSSRFDALKATEVRIQDLRADGSNPFPGNVDERLHRLSGVNHGGLIFTVPDNGGLRPRQTPDAAQQSDRPVQVVAATPGALLASLPTLRTGRVYDAFHEREAQRVAVVGRTAAEQTNIFYVDHQPVLFIGDHPYTVIGIVDDVERNADVLLSVVIPVAAATRDFGSRNATFEVLIDTEQGAAALIGRQAPLALRPNDPDRLISIVPPDPQSLRNRVESDVTGLYYALAALALLIGTIAIANATMLSAIERRPEIGLRRALGAKRSHIVRQITLEAAITGTFAAIVGAGIGIVVIGVVANQRGWMLTISPTAIWAAPAIGLITGACAGVIPALRAARTPPATTLRS